MVLRIIRLQFKFILVFCLSSVLIFAYMVLVRSGFQSEIDREALLEQMELTMSSENDSSVCKPPNLSVNSPEMMKFMHNVPPIDCSGAGANWVKCKGSICSIQEKAKALHKKIVCQFTDIIRVNDDENSEGKTVVSDETYQLVDSDVVKVACKAAKKKWSSIFTSVRKNDSIWEEATWYKAPKDSLQMNVLMFGLDSLSRNLFIRKLPKTYDYIKKNLKGVVLEGYNIVGDGTPQALIPMLTGQTELELPDTRKRFPNTQFVNSYPFIWNEYKKAGYVTGFLEDTPTVSIFTYRLNGFKEVPTDHYMRPFYLSELTEHRKWPKYCTADTPRHKVMTDFIKDFFDVYRSKPKFMFGFHGELSHDNYNLVGAADQDLTDFLAELYESNLLNNTILIFFADHGHRFAEIRNTLQGKLEERLPFCSFILPPWFQKKHSILYNNLKKNIKTLTTPFDIYATLKNVLNLKLKDEENKWGRSLSLFSEIPPNRSCSQAFIEPHWCACLNWHPLKKHDPIVPYLSRTLVQYLNKYTSQYRNLCDMWKLRKVNWASKLNPNEKLVKFKRTSDRDGFLGDFSGQTQIEKELYQINVELEPSGALFEASISHRLKDDNFEVKISDISRINMYGKQARCIELSYPHLRKFCHCKN